tara:strand:+ start:97 stop:627 length:531 start_codon:yes stop_codon:yes gene_type:complete
MRVTPFNCLIYPTVALLMGGSVACETKSVESIIGRGEVRTLVAELQKAKTCEVYRVDDSYPEGNRIIKGNEIQGFSVLSEAQPIKDDSRKALSQILLNPDTYFQHSVPVDCGFRPGIAFRFSDGIIEVDVLVCFSCRELRYYSAGKLVGESHFKSPEILALTKKLFPDDKIIQALK